MELSNSNIEKFLKTETTKKFFIFQETELSYISESNFHSLKKFLIFRGNGTF